MIRTASGRGVFALRGGKASVKAGLEGFGAAVGISGLANEGPAVERQGQGRFGRHGKILAPSATRPAASRNRQTVTCMSSSVVRSAGAVRLTLHLLRRSGVAPGGLQWVSGNRDFRIVQTTCKAMGHEDCRFDVYKEPLN